MTVESSVTYRVNDLYATIQGEGRMVGTPMILLRLHGCSVGCTFCDTKESWATGDAALPRRRATLAEARGTNDSWAELSAEALAREVCLERERSAPGTGWVLLTGGEPAEQPIRPLVRALHANGFRVALETSGTARGHLADGADASVRVMDETPADAGRHAESVPHGGPSAILRGSDCDFVCCSPKIDNPGGLPILSEVVRGADEIKMVIGRERDVERFGEFLREHAIGDMSRISLQPMSASRKATELCVAAALRLGCRVSIQTHKVIGVR